MFICIYISIYVYVYTCIYKYIYISIFIYNGFTPNPTYRKEMLVVYHDEMQ